MNSTGLFRLLGDGELVTFRDVGDYIAKLPGRKHAKPERQFAIKDLMFVAAVMGCGSS